MGILEKMRLDGKTVLVTGGAQGIGKSIALAVAEAGGDVAIADINIAEAQRAAEEIASLGVKASAFECDVTKETGVAAMAARVKKEFGGLNAAFCNAGIALNKPAIDMTPGEWQRVIDVNLTGVFLTAQAAARLMRENPDGGSIVMTASMSGHVVNIPQPQCGYNASKAGVIMLAKSMAVEWAPYRIRVNTISPGYIGTDLILNAPALAPLIEQWEAITPMKRVGRPDELQAIAVYLAGDASSYATGSDFIVDGAYTCV